VKGEKERDEEDKDGWVDRWIDGGEFQKKAAYRYRLHIRD
jgi:hypothetical protein